MKKKAINLILYFVRGPRPRPEDRTAATTLAAATGKNVAFRNANHSGAGDKPEAALGCAGCAPESYRAAMPYFEPDGAETRPTGAALAPEESFTPADKEQLRKALDEMGVEYHPNTGAEKLAALYRKAKAEQAEACPPPPAE